MSEEVMDLEDLTPKQLRKMIGRIMRSRLPSHMKTDEEKDADSKKAVKDNDDLADLMAENKNTNTPKVTKADLPKSDDDEEEAEEEAEEKKKED